MSERDLPLSPADEGRSPEEERKRSRRFVLKLVATGFAAAGAANVSPVVAFGQQGATGSPQDLSKEPVDRPYAYTMSACNGLVDMEGWNAVYSFTAWGHFAIDAADKATFSDLVLSGTFVSGTDHGPVTIKQTGPSNGTYAGHKISIAVPVTYSDATAASVDAGKPTTLIVSGDVFKGGSEITMNFQPGWPDDDDPPVVPIWSKATC